MIDEHTKKRIMTLCNKPAGLGGWLGMSGEGEEWCIKFAAKFYQEMGIEATVEALKEARHFTKVDEPRFGDIAVFRGPPLLNERGEEEFHLAVMLDSNLAIQSMKATNGVGKIHLDRYPWNQTLKGIYRHEQCS